MSNHVEAVLMSKKIPDLCLDFQSPNGAFDVIHWQCEGHLTLDGGILNVHGVEFVNKALLFVKLAKENNAALVLTPEYSFPWECLDTIINDPELQPSRGKLWCLCMQYCSMQEFAEWCKKRDVIKTDMLPSRITYDTSTPLIVFDEFRTIKKFANVLTYVFLNAQNQLTVILQSKLAHMGDPLYHFEAADLSLGKRIYVFDYNKSTSRAFCTLICADAMYGDYYKQIEEALSSNDGLSHPVFLFNPQLNPNPNHKDFLDNIDNRIKNEWVFMRLNWAISTEILSNRLDAFGTEYVHKSAAKVENTWNSDSFRKSYIQGRSHGLHYSINDGWKSKWVFPSTEHVVHYFLKSPKRPSNAASPIHEFVVKEIYIYNHGWVLDTNCLIAKFRQLLPHSENLLNDFIEAMDGIRNSGCAGSICDDQNPENCVILFFDRFVSLFQGTKDHEVIIESVVEGLINSCITNIHSQKHEQIINNEFGKISKIAAYLSNIVAESEVSLDRNIRELKNIVPDGVHLDVYKKFPQNSLGMFNVTGNPPDSRLQKGMAIYTKETTTPELNYQLEQCARITDVEDLGVMLFYPDADATVKLYPNPRWSSTTDTGIARRASSDNSYVGI